MAGSISSLGIGSGVLTADVIDKLKENERSATVTPIENKITLQEQKGQALDLLDSLLTTFKANVSALDYDVLYQERSVSGNNDGIEVTADAGVGVQNFSLEVTTLAKNSVLQSGSFATSTDKVAPSGGGTLNINVAGANFGVDYDNNMNLEDLKKAINDAAGDSVTASVLQTGENAYSLVVTSDETGKAQSVTLTDLGGNLDSRLVSDAEVSGTIASSSTVIASSNAQMNINIGGTDYQINYTNGMTLQGLVDTINNDATLNTQINASIVKYGNNDYRMVLSNKSSTQNQSITVTDLGAGLDANVLSAAGTSVAGGANVIQDPNDASFKYNGITLTRSSNTIDDIQLGLSIKLKQEGATSNISITQDTQKIADELSALTTSYNTLISQLDEMTLTDLDKGKTGIFNGDNTIKSIGREITNIITSVDSNGRSLAQYGISLDQAGKMSFSQSDFDTKFSEDPNAAELFFSGGTDSNGKEVQGLFNKLDTTLESYVGSTGLMSTLTSASSSSIASLKEDRTHTIALLDARYNTMSDRFVAFDSIISRINAQSQSLLQQIQMAVNAKN